jgi:N-acyl homoserine lactone hydrolase
MRKPFPRATWPAAAAILLAALLGAAGLAQSEGGLERLYILDCGTNFAKDQSRWTPGANEGQPIEFSDNCYLLRHAKGLLLWDTGITDAVAAMPDGLVVAGGAIVQRRAKTLVSQLDALGVKPADITYVAISHTHSDHVGNIGLFTSSTVLIQGAEYDWAMSQPMKPAFAPSQRIEKLAGDHDVFGDGSVVIFSTPGHTPGHQSLLVVLPKTGAIVLSGDAVHLQDNWDHRRVPSMNTSREQTLASLDRIASVLADRKAQLWINHDLAQSRGLRHAPEPYE